MEGISSEALSLAGTWHLTKLTVLYDCNHISIEGGTDMAFTEDVEKRVQAFGFKTLHVQDGNDLEAIGKAIETAKADTSAPYFLIIHTEIGYGCPAKQGTAAAHGAPLGEENILEMKDFLKWPSREPFYVPQEVYDHCQEIADGKRPAEDSWNALFAKYREEYPDLAAKWDAYHSDAAIEALKDDKDFFAPAPKPEATRASSGAVIQYIKDKIPNLFGGSADLAPSTKTDMKGEPFFSDDVPEGRNIHFGVREMAMGASANGMLLHGGLRTYIGTFFVFSDYMKPMMRLAALMEIPQIYVLTHDSIGVGEDGPTHEPVEQLAMLRAIPNFHVFRPCSRIETEAAWYMALSSKKTPTALILTRQALSQEGSAEGAMKGGYVLKDCEGTPEIILIATGSEVELALQAAEKLTGDGHKTRVVSMPCTEVFDEQSEEYRESVLPKAVRKRVAIEAAVGFGWEKYTGLDGAVIGMKTFGLSAPQSKLFEHFGYTVENVVKTAEGL
jgi:transketolase